MPVLLLFLGLSVLIYMWVARRGSTLTRACRWRLDRSLGPSGFRCASCGAVCDADGARSPRQCLRGR